jgi:hypothetical protein
MRKGLTGNFMARSLLKREGIKQVGSKRKITLIDVNASL